MTALIMCPECRGNISAKAAICPHCGAPVARTSLALETLDTLIVVPGHAVYVGSEPSQSRITANWRGTFEGYQENDEAALYCEHIRTGVLIASRGKEPKSLLVFSGGETRRKAGPYAEAQSYWFLASQNSWFEHPEVEERATTEEYARDSFENLLFSLHRFRQCTGRLPVRVLVCGFSFKSRRYELHWRTIFDNEEDKKIRLAGLKLLDTQFSYIGVNDPPSYILQGPGGSEEGETKTCQDWESDPFGEYEPLRIKELERDPYLHFNPYGLKRSKPKSLKNRAKRPRAAPNPVAPADA